jgi:hypothetical protein
VKRLAAISAALALAAAALVASCRQGEGDRCQVNADCEDNLICNQATQRCARTAGGDIDADVPDPPIPDMALPDAAVDAMIDAMIDAPDAM